MIGVEQEITNFTYSNITQTTLPFSSTTPYLLNDLARVGSYHYKSTHGTVGLPNLANPPLSNLGTHWFKWEPSNLYACLDPFSETTTTWAGDGVIEFLRGSKDKLIIGNFKAKEVKIEYIDSAENVLTDYTQTYLFSNNRGVNSPWTYGYAGFNGAFEKSIYKSISRVGTKIRVTLSNDGNDTYLGFIVAGKSINFGQTLDDVELPDNRIGSRTVNTAQFRTAIDDYLLIDTTLKGKSLVDVPMVFIIDESENSRHQNIVILGKIKQCSSAATTYSKNQISWRIEQNIIEGVE